MSKKMTNQQSSMGKISIYEMLKPEISDKKVIFIDPKNNKKIIK